MWHGYPNPDYAAILPDDTRLSWLQRTETNYTWTVDDLGEPIGYYVSGPPPDYGYARMTISEAEFELYKAKLQLRLPPIWPGADKVTFTETVPCAGTTTITAPMDGILLTVTGHPATLGKWGDAPSYYYYHFGRVAFINDEGQLEPFQYVGWTEGLVCPKTMTRAAGVLIYLEPNCQAAATPWTIT